MTETGSIDVNRRRLLKVATLLPLAAASGAAWARSTARAQVRFAIDAHRAGRVVDPSLVGLSYETVELGDPSFFHADNHGLVRLFRELNPQGVLRIGGNTSDDTVWSGYTGALPPFVARHYGLKQRFVLHPDALPALAGFLRATGWRLVFGVNLRLGVPAMAVALAQAVQQAVGDRLLAIQIGNEANNYFHDYASFDAAWQPYATALRAAGLPLAGPDTGANTDWVVDYARKHGGEDVFLSRHYYRGAATEGSIPNLLAEDAEFLGEVERIMAAADATHRPFRLTEANSYYLGGRDGVSNVFASALWSADFLLALAQRGVAGVHFHGGTLRSVEASLGREVHGAAEGDVVAQRDAVSSRYSLIAGNPALGSQPRPAFFGAVLAGAFAGARMLGGSLAAAGANVTAYAAQQGESLLVALINKDATRDVDVALDGVPAGARGSVRRLLAPSLTSRHGTAFGPDGDVLADARGRSHVTLPRASAVLVAWQGGQGATARRA